jgi:hypothetical protein
LQFQISKVGGGQRSIAEPELSQLEENKLICSARWVDGERMYKSYEVLTILDGKIVDMQSCKSRREAERFARRR